MSSILDALKKLEEEKQRQLRILEKEEEEEQQELEPVSITAIAEPDTSPPLAYDIKQSFLSPKSIIAGVIILIISICIVSVSLSLWVVKTQLAQNRATPSITTESITTSISTSQSTPNISSSTPTEKMNPQPEISEDKKALPTSEENQKQENIVATPEPVQDNKPPHTNKKVEQSPTMKNDNAISTEQPSKSEKPPIQMAKNTSDNTSPPVEEKIKEETQKETSTPPASETIKDTTKSFIPETTPSEATPPSANNQNQMNDTPNPPTVPEETSHASSPTQVAKVENPPQVITRDLAPPPSIKPEQFQQILPKPEPEPNIDMTKLPVLKTSDRVRLGLEDMKLNVLREAGPKNPHGLAIINLTKVYVGEMIPGTSVRLLDVKTHGIAIEVVGTGERYYVPR